MSVSLRRGMFLPSHCKLPWRLGQGGIIAEAPFPRDLLFIIIKEADCENGKRLHNPRPCEEMSRVEGEQQAGQRWPGQGGALNTHPSA